MAKKVVIAALAYKAGKGHAKRKAKNSSLKQAAHSGRTPVASPRSAQSGNTAVPVSVIALAPGQGPSMSSTPTQSRAVMLRKNKK